MALQHFYSRVPARVSMYNRADGFDTFAHSEGLEREFIERELTVLYENKLSKNDMTRIRKDELPPVYSQCCSKSGRLMQACIRYLPLDYTGERSAYLSHSLIFSEEECQAILCGRETAVFSPENFVKTIADFDITSSDAAPDSSYPAIDYTVAAMDPAASVLVRYDAETVKGFLFAILMTLCGKGKPVYFKFPVPGSELSATALRLINEIMTVIPCHMRASLSFVTYVNDLTQYNNFKLKCIPAEHPEIPLAKGVFFDFHANLVLGLHPNDVSANKPLLNFFYSMLGNREMRNEFLLYVDRAVKAVPALQNMSLKTLTDLVFLFWGISGLFPESVVLPNDAKVYDFLCGYEKYRAALNDEHRVRAYACLTRYPQKHEAIPKNIFSKVTKLYPSENKPAKRVAMNVVLELIHTDIMREKLFVFIRNNYEGEDEDIRQLIVADLCRVFYGGFLQPQILDFFHQRFDTELPSSQNMIVEKLLLSIRTTAIRPKILDFLDVHYDYFSDAHKTSLYDTFFEMLPECDDLSVALVRFLNRHIGKESGESIAALSERLTTTLEADYKKKEHKLLPILVAEHGFCWDTVVKRIFSDWSTRKILPEYLDLLRVKSVKEKTEDIVRVFEITPSVPIQAQNKLVSAFGTLYDGDMAKTDLYTWLTVDVLVAKSLQGETASLARQFREKVTQRGIKRSLYDVFKTRYRKDGIEVIRRYAEMNSAICAFDGYKTIESYVAMLEELRCGDITKAVKHLSSLSEDAKIRSDIAGHITACAINRDAQTTEEVWVLDLFAAYLKTGNFASHELYTRYYEMLKTQALAHQGEKANTAKAMTEASSAAMQTLFDCHARIGRANKALRMVVCSEETELKDCIRDFIRAYGRGAEKWLHTQFAHNEISPEFSSYFISIIADSRPKDTSFWSKLFSKK